MTALPEGWVATREYEESTSGPAWRATRADGAWILIWRGGMVVTALGSDERHDEVGEFHGAPEALAHLLALRAAHLSSCAGPEPSGGPTLPEPRAALMSAIATELDHAYRKHGRDPWGRHEFYAILLEEVEELWAEVKADGPQEKVLAELRQVAAMCFRYAETGDRYLGNHPPMPSRAERGPDAGRGEG